MISETPCWSEGQTVEADICIVGAGLVGLAIAQTFIGSRAKVLVLEGGGWRPTISGQDALWAETSGTPNHSFSFSRFRGYGGSGSQWAGICPRLEPFDFSGRGRLPAWPVSHQALEPWYDQAETLLDVQHPSSEIHKWASSLGNLLDLGDDLRPAILPIARKRDLGQNLRDKFRTASNVQVALGTDVTEIETDPSCRKVLELRASLSGGRSVRVASRVHILAAGGVENARLLLLSNKHSPRGLGNAYNQVGRAFMDHIYCDAGRLVSAYKAIAQSPHVVKRFAELPTGPGAIAAFVLKDQVLREEGLNGAAAFFIHRAAFQLHPDYDSLGGAAVTHFAEIVRGERLPDRSTPGELKNLLLQAPSAIRQGLRQFAHVLVPSNEIALRMQIEASPNFDSRVSLTEVRDRFGRQRARINWQVDKCDGLGATRLWRALAEGIQARGLGQLVGKPPGQNGYWPASTTGGKHHMGTTRMSNDPAKGVVNSDCRVHGIENLYVAGSSVFPSGGWGNPTLTAVAFGLRLAANLLR